MGPCLLLLILLLFLSSNAHKLLRKEEDYQGIPSSSSDKIVLLNDLSLEQAYLHHSKEGSLPSSSSSVPSATLAQQAVRLAAGAYAGDTGHAPGGAWRVRATYKNLNSVAVISSRDGEEGGGMCALAFRGSDDRLDWRNDYRARHFPLMLCAQENDDEDELEGQRYFLELLTRTGDRNEDEEKEEEEQRRRRQQQRPRRPANGSQPREQQPQQAPQRQARCPRRLGIYTLHYGFYQSFRLLLSGTSLEEDWWMLTHNGTCNPHYSLVTGHSLGGAFTIYAKILGWPGLPVTFAAPRAVANGSCPSSLGADTLPVTRIYLTDDPVPATLPVSDVTRFGLGGPWVHCGCALSLEPSAPVAEGMEVKEKEKEKEKAKTTKEHFAAKAQGCGSNEPLLMPSLLPSPPQPSPLLLGNGGDGSLGRRERGKEEEEEEDARRGGMLPSGLMAPANLKRHLHTRYVRAVNAACQGPLDSMRCLFDHEV